MIDARSGQSPSGEGLTPIDAVVTVAQSELPSEWQRYGELAERLMQLVNWPQKSQEEAARELLGGDGKHRVRVRAKHDASQSMLRTLAKLGGPPKSDVEIAVAETKELEALFRNRLVAAVQKDRYVLVAFDRFDPITVPPRLVKPESLNFAGDILELNGIKLTGVRFVQARPRSQSSPPGRKPGQDSSKAEACRIALSILDDDARRPPRRRGRLAQLTRMVCGALNNDGKPYQANTIEKLIRNSVKEWEEKNSDL